MRGSNEGEKYAEIKKKGENVGVRCVCGGRASDSESGAEVKRKREG